MRVPTDEDGVKTVAEWCKGTVIEPLTSLVDGVSITTSISLEIETLEGTMTALPGDYVIKGIEGEFYPCKPSIFIESYELILDGK